MSLLKKFSFFNLIVWNCSYSQWSMLRELDEQIKKVNLINWPPLYSAQIKITYYHLIRRYQDFIEFCILIFTDIHNHSKSQDLHKIKYVKFIWLVWVIYMYMQLTFSVVIKFYGIKNLEAFCLMRPDCHIDSIWSLFCWFC